MTVIENIRGFLAESACRLKNYTPEEWGDEIIVERKLYGRPLLSIDTWNEYINHLGMGRPLTEVMEPQDISAVINRALLEGAK
jgi:hypothetical protein